MAGEEGVVVHIIVALLLSPITIISLIVVYQLFTHLCCCISNHPNKQEENPSISNTNADPKNNVQSVSKSKSKSKSPPLTTSTQADQIHSFFRYTTLISCVLFCAVCVLIMIHRIVVIFNTTGPSVFAIFVYLFWFVGRMILTLIFIGTLYFAFRGSIFEYSKRTMSALIIFWITMPLFAVSSLFLWAVSTPLMIVCSVLFVLVDIVLSVVLLYLYLKQLFHLIYGDHQIFISVFVRYTLLYSICFTSSVTVFILFGLTPVFKSDDNKNYGRMLFFFISIDSLINTLCLWLKLKIAQKWYLRLCNSLHNKMVICCNYCSKHATNDESMIIVEIDQQRKQQKQQKKTQQTKEEQQKQPQKQNIEENKQQSSEQQTEEQTDDRIRITVQTETKNTAIIL